MKAVHLAQPSEAKESLAEAFEACIARAPAWLAQERRESFARFVAAGFPSMREESWRQTSLSALAKTRVGLASLPETLDPGLQDRVAARVGQLRISSAETFVLLDGTLLARPAEGLGFELRALSSLAQSERPPSVQATSERFVALAKACADESWVIRFRHQSERPIQLIYLASSDAENVISSHSRVQIHALAGSSGTLIETFASLQDGPAWSNASTDVVLERDAKLTHVRIQEESASTHTGSVVVHQRENSRYESLVLSTGGKLSRCELEVQLAGEGAECRLNGLYVADADRHVDHQTRVEHRVKGCTSREFYRGIVSGQAKAIFDGKVVVAKGADRTDAEQSSRNLLLSDRAWVHAKPHLEIYADDVKCKHGATVGRLDREALFYLRSRGIALQEAERLLIRAFALEPLAALEAPLREALEGRIEVRLREGT